MKIQYRHRLPWKFIILLWIIIPFVVNGQSNDGKGSFSILPVPTFGYEPETRAYLGAIVQCSWTNPGLDSAIRQPSNFALEFSYTQNRQSILEFDGDILIGSRFRIMGYGELSNYPYTYFGKSLSITKDVEEDYTTRWIDLDLEFLYRTSNPRLFVGIETIFIDYELRKYPLNGELIADLGAESNRYFGSGPVLMLDKRDNQLNPSRGPYLHIASHVFNTSAIDYTFDFRAYKNGKHYFLRPMSILPTEAVTPYFFNGQQETRCIIEAI